MDLAYIMMLVNELLNKYPDIVPEETPIIILDNKSAMCIAKNGKDNKNKRHITRISHFVSNSEN